MVNLRELGLSFIPIIAITLLVPPEGKTMQDYEIIGKPDDFKLTEEGNVEVRNGRSILIQPRADSVGLVRIHDYTTGTGRDNATVDGSNGLHLPLRRGKEAPIRSLGNMVVKYLGKR